MGNWKFTSSKIASKGCHNSWGAYNFNLVGSKYWRQRRCGGKIDICRLLCYAYKCSQLISYVSCEAFTLLYIITRIVQQYTSTHGFQIGFLVIQSDTETPLYGIRWWHMSRGTLIQRRGRDLKHSVVNAPPNPWKEHLPNAWDQHFLY